MNQKITMSLVAKILLANVAVGVSAVALWYMFQSPSISNDEEEEILVQHDASVDTVQRKNENEMPETIDLDDTASTPSAATDESNGQLFHRVHNWHSASPENLIEMHKNVKDIDACEAICEKNSECESVTFMVDERCIVQSGSIRHGEFNPAGISSMKSKSKQECYLPVRMTEGKNTLPSDAKCHKSEHDAVNALLKDAQPLAAFGKVLSSRKEGYFH